MAETEAGRQAEGLWGVRAGKDVAHFVTDPGGFSDAPQSDFDAASYMGGGPAWQNFQWGEGRADAWREALGKGAQGAYSGFTDTMTAQAAWQGRQEQLADLLNKAARGEVLSAAEIQMKQALERALASQQSMAAQATGANRALAQRTAAMNTAQLQQGAAAETGMLRAREQAQAQALLAQTMQGARAEDLAAAKQYQDLLTYYTSQGMNLEQAQLAANMAYENIRSGQAQTATQVQGNVALANQQAAQASQGGMMSAGGSILGTLVTKSDRRAKEQIRPAGREVDAFLKALHAESWEYKDKADGAGRHYGFMAQDAERSRLGKSLVIDTPRGKMVDLKRTAMLSLAASQRLDERLRTLEKKLGTRAA